MSMFGGGKRTLGVEVSYIFNVYTLYYYDIIDSILTNLLSLFLLPKAFMSTFLLSYFTTLCFVYEKTTIKFCGVSKEL